MNDTDTISITDLLIKNIDAYLKENGILGAVATIKTGQTDLSDSVETETLYRYVIDIVVKGDKCLT
jgi:hypothetical protein